MKTKILPVLFAFIICLFLFISCIPVGASDIDISTDFPSGDEVLQPDSIIFDCDDTDDFVTFYLSPHNVINGTECFVYGNTTPTNYTLWSSSDYYGSSYYIGYDDGEICPVFDCWLTFPDFYFDTSVSGPIAPNAVITLPDSDAYASCIWTADITYFSRNDGQKYTVQYTQRSTNSSGPAQFSIPVQELCSTYVPHYDFVNVQNLRASISVTDGTAYNVAVKSSSGQFVQIGTLLPDSIITEVTEVTPNLFDWIITPLDSFLNIQIVPPDPSGDFGGATIGGVLALVIAIPLLVAFLKVFAGG